MSERVYNETKGSQTVSMYHRFVELMLIVGLDENTGLVPISDISSSSDRSSDILNIFEEEYEAQVLAAISSSKALIFQPTLMEDPSYPPSQESFSDMEGSSMRLVSSSKDRNTSSKRSHSTSTSRSVHVNVAVLKQRLERSESTTNIELPLSKDAIEGITTFCFPDNARVYRLKPDNTIHFLVLTDVKGTKTYATCLTFYRLYKIEKNDDGRLSCLTQDAQLHSHSFASLNEISCYMPQCCVLVSKYPYFYAMKECLSYMISHGERDQEEMFQFLKDFTFSMTMTPVPPAGNVSVELRLYNMNITLFPAEWPDKPVVDIPLHLAFLSFPMDDLLKIFAAILCEERIVFVSFNYALLTIIMEAFLYYILPFKWRFTYVPILSTSSLELLEAPGTFMMGCHSKHLDVVEQVEGLVVVNIDEGTVSMNMQAMPRLERRASLGNDILDVTRDTSSLIPALPVEPANIFRKICQRARFQLELADVQRPFYFDMDQERAFRMKKCLQFNTEIGFACLEMMVNLFRGVLSYLRIDLRRFNRHQFMDDLPDSDKPFYERVLNTEIFKSFLEDRLDEKVDYWSDHEMKTRPYAKRNSSGRLSLSGTGFSHRQQMKPQQRQASVTTFSSLLRRDLKFFELPPLNDAVTYTKSSIAKLQSLIEECSDPDQISSYMYLRGMFYAAEGNMQSALEDFLSLHAHNARLMPVDLVGKLLKLIPESERGELLRQKSINHLAELSQNLEHESNAQRRGIIENISIPKSDLCIENFVETVSLLEMATDYDTIQRLFLTLALPMKPSHVDQYTFEVLQLSYEENQAQCESISLPDGCLQSNEIILRVSNLIKTDLGMGRIALTDKRLFFIKDVSNMYTEIVKLRNISRLEKLQLHSFLIAVDALCIEDSDKKVKFTATLKEDRNLWALIINEMRAGKVVAEATKDFTVINQAVQNVLLVDAVIRSGRDEHTSHHDRFSFAAESLCYFTLYMNEGRHNLPHDTICALQHRVDPNMGQRERKTVEVMLYTAGTDETMENSRKAVSPRLWCGMGDGKIRVFDASNWALEDTLVQTRQTVATLVAVGETQVWAGSHGIFIIDTQTITCNKTLTDHPDLVVAIVVTSQGRYAYSASVEGTIIQWEVQTLRCVRRLCLTGSSSLKSIKIYDNKLWCGTWHHITALDMDGTHLQTFSLTNPSLNGNYVDLDCFSIFRDEIWAGCRREGRLIIWDVKSTRLKKQLTLESRGISVILLCDDKVWVGTKDGTIHIYHADTKEVWKTIKAHEDAIRSLCAAESRYILSGAGSMDGKVAIWNPNFDDTEGDSVKLL